MGGIVKIYNTPLEIGLRILVILSIDQDAEYDTDRLVYYDYFTLYPSDYSDLHIQNDLQVKTPYRSGEIIIKRELITAACNLLISRGLIDIKYNQHGMFYKANESTPLFLKYLNSKFYLQLRDNAGKIVSALNKKKFREIEEYLNQNIANWGTEFEYESVFRS